MLSVFIPLFILLKFKHLQCLLTFSYSLLFTRFNFIEGSLCPAHVIVKAFHRLLKNVPLGPQGSFRTVYTLTRLFERLLSNQQCGLSLMQLGVLQYLRSPFL